VTVTTQLGDHDVSASVFWYLFSLGCFIGIAPWLIETYALVGVATIRAVNMRDSYSVNLAPRCWSWSLVGRLRLNALLVCDFPAIGIRFYLHPHRRDVGLEARLFAWRLLVWIARAQGHEG
jgi:hypothetical protein